MRSALQSRSGSFFRRMMATTDSLNDTANLELTEGRHASAARAEEVKVELMRVNVFAPYEMAMRQKDQVSQTFDCQAWGSSARRP